MPRRLRTAELRTRRATGSILGLLVGGDDDGDGDVCCEDDRNASVTMG